MEGRTDYERSFGSYPDDGLRDRGTPDLIREFLDQGRVLLREEMRLFRAELRHELVKAKSAGIALGAAGALCAGGLIVWAFCLVFVGWTFLPLWASALIVGALLLAAAGVAWLFARDGLRRIHPPERTLTTLKEDARWARDTMQSVKSRRHANA